MLKILKLGMRSAKAEAYTLYLVGKDSRTPLLAKIICAGMVVYMIDPIDIIPDFIPVLGWLDDVAILGIGFWLVKRITPEAVWFEASQKASSVNKTVVRVRKTFTILMVLLWIFIALIVCLGVYYVVRRIASR